MPQFDTFTFFSQLFWVFLLFLTLYISFLRWVLPAISITLKIRKKLAQQEAQAGEIDVKRSLLQYQAAPLFIGASSCCKRSVLASGQIIAPESCALPNSVATSALVSGCCAMAPRISKARGVFLHAARVSS
jgi:hypothetical protein